MSATSLFDHKLLFPVTLPVQWQSPIHCEINKGILDWLLDPNSLTARLKQNCQTFHVEVLGQHIEPCTLDEANCNVSVGEDVLIREVLLYCDNIPQVFARSLLPLASLTGAEQQLAHLGDQPLGQVIFSNPSLERKNIEIARFDHKSPVAQLAHSLGLNFDVESNPAQVMWGRRSTFLLHNKPFIVAEVFLPNAIAYTNKINSL